MSSEKALPPELLSSVVARGLRLAIVEGHLQPGDRIRQESIAKEYGTSRIPVRDALQRLQNEGLVTLGPHLGARVARLALDDFRELYEIRERLEPLAVSHSAANLAEADLAALEADLDEMDSALADGDLVRWIEVDRRFHLHVSSRAVMPRLLRLIEELWNTSQQYRRMYVLLPTRGEIARLEHRLLFEALRRKDSDDAGRVCLMHIRRTRMTLTEHPELFAQSRHRERGQRSRQPSSMIVIP